ncbi:MAG: hypothetical protein KatS3mg060_0378 [Dehalococcoidia bacterium]|nr:MAG: hypothetical protein KatS3mg060_0378 [Dehalococcoidia bacterium]
MRTVAQVVVAGGLVWIAVLQATFGPVGPVEWAPLVWMWLSGCAIGALMGVFVASTGDRRR